MKLERQVLFWIAVFLVALALIWLLRGVLLPFVAGLALAYLLDPLATRIERLGVNRVAATFVMIVALVAVLALLAVFIVPVVASQAVTFITSLPDYVAKLQAMVTDPSRPMLGRIVGDSLPDFKAETFVKDASGAAGVFLKSLWSGSRALASIVSVLVIAPVVAFYLLLDWKHMVKVVDDALPRDHADTIRRLAREIDAAVAGFVRGQTGVCATLAVYYSVAFALAGLNYGVLIGLAAGIGTFIPYVGSFIGIAVSLGIAVVQFWPSWTPILVVLGIGVAGQTLESYVLSPYLVGSSVGLHPVWLMFALLAFGYLFGFVGLIVAIPLAAAVAVLVRFAFRRYRESPMYLGSGPS